eukprot:2190055-Alexandrium_andersonii.AAC.1
MLARPSGLPNMLSRLSVASRRQPWPTSLLHRRVAASNLLYGYGHIHTMRWEGTKTTDTMARPAHGHACTNTSHRLSEACTR